MSNYRYQLEKYRGRGTRYTCPQCGRKQSFTRYIDTYNNNIYINDNVGICNRIDKCGYHYTPKQYYTDNPWKRDVVVEKLKMIGKFNISTSTTTKPHDYIPEWVWEYSRSHGIVSEHHQWLECLFGREETERIAELYGMGATREGHAIFWQRDIEGRLRTGKIMAYDPTTGHRLKSEGSIGWVHSLLKRSGHLAEGWELGQCLYGEHLLRARPDAVVALVEAYKTAHVGAVLMPDYVWLATDSLMGLSAERLQVLTGRRVILFPDDGKGYEVWSEKMEHIARSVGLSYRVSRFTELHAMSQGDDFVDCVEREAVASYEEILH